MHKARLGFSGLLVVLALSAVTTSSASAFSWWVGTTPKSSEILAEGVKLPLVPAATVKSPFTLKWFKEFQVKCAAAKYNEAFLEGRVFLGAAGIIFETCTVAKPAGFSVQGGKIETRSLFGEIKPVGAKVEFNLVGEENEETGEKGPVASFGLEGPTACPLLVTVGGVASGLISNPSKLSNVKSFLFNSTGLSVVQVKNCGGAPVAAKGKKHPKEEGEGKIESNKGNVTYSSEASFWSAH